MGHALFKWIWAIEAKVQTGFRQPLTERSWLADELHGSGAEAPHDFQ
jgi:hypothetical protein